MLEILENLPFDIANCKLTCCFVEGIFGIKDNFAIHEYRNQSISSARTCACSFSQLFQGFC